MQVDFCLSLPNKTDVDYVLFTYFAMRWDIFCRHRYFWDWMSSHLKGTCQFLNSNFSVFPGYCTSFSYIFPLLPAKKLNTIKRIGMFMKSPNDIWAYLGNSPDEKIIHMMTKLFAIYGGKVEI